MKRPKTEKRRSLDGLLVVCVVSLTIGSTPLAAQTVPHGQDRPPGPALSPEEAIARMEVPEGFHVELVAAEPQIVNPVAMTFDERGRIWVTESLEYPRLSEGPGRDRIKILEDTDHDGRVDSVKIFADGLNIPSGIAVGHGGVWVANSPDILFMKDTDGDDKADVTEVVVTGFGRRDTHELPNSLTWGPDGFLYGLNGVFNPSVVKQGDREFRFTCALFRIDPRTRRFELFAEGTSNPWGVAWNPYGDAFLSACVIDHLWHLTESGYYHRQGGPYPPFTWKLESIVDHKHQKAAYCGIHYFDSDAYPRQYRDRLYMGNIHGNCVNVDVLEQRGATYVGTPEEDFLKANDAWFMTVSQKTGPDGCLYVLDWYDRYHCYQDARRDPEGIDRLKGRLYRIRYRDTPRAAPFDLARETDAQLLARLGSPNVFFRDQAQRILVERGGGADREPLRQLVLADDTPYKQRMHALWSLAGTGKLDDSFLLALLRSSHPDLRAWGVRAAGNQGRVSSAARELIEQLAADLSPRVVVQVAIAARKIQGLDPIPVLTRCLLAAGDDIVIPHIVWQNLHPLLETRGADFLAGLKTPGTLQFRQVGDILPRAIDRILAAEQLSAPALAALVELATSQEGVDNASAVQSLRMLAERVQTRELTGARLEELRAQLQPRLQRTFQDQSESPIARAAAELAASWGDRSGLNIVLAHVRDHRQPFAERLQGLKAVVAADATELRDVVRALFGSPASDEELSGLLSVLGRADQPVIADVVLESYPGLNPQVQPRAIELLTDRPDWSRRLLAAIGDQRIPAAALNVNQVRKLLASGDQTLIAAVADHWGTVRTERDPAREELIKTMRVRLRRSLDQADPVAGQLVFRKVCAQCHVIYGEGQQVGPDITLNGRASYEQLLSNVFDPSLVIGAAYQPMTVVTTAGRVVTGLVVEDSPQRVILKVQGGKLETIARDDIDESAISQLSLMPEGLEKQLTGTELADLFAFLTLDRPPQSREARRIPGTTQVAERRARSPREYPGLLDEVMPGFRTEGSGEGGIWLVPEYADRHVVIRTHPVSQQQGCSLKRKVEIPAQATARLIIETTHDDRGDWQLLVKANGQQLLSRLVATSPGEDRWKRFDLDLSEFAGQSVELELLNQPTGWSWEFAYWSRVDVVIELPKSAAESQ